MTPMELGTEVVKGILYPAAFFAAIAVVTWYVWKQGRK
jgi:hypothetical protein